MGRSRNIEVYSGYRFMVLGSGDKLVGVTAVFQDPFSDSVIVKTGHIQGEPSRLQELAQGDKFSVFLLAFSSGVARQITVEFDPRKAKIRTLNLDASEAEPAFEYLTLFDAKVRNLGDIPAAELPEPVKEYLARR